MPASDHSLHQHIASKPRLSRFDRIVVVASFLYPLSATSQVISVFGGHTEGVSVFSWLGFFVFASLFLAYGVKHQIIPMIIANSIWVVMDALVVFGILVG